MGRKCTRDYRNGSEKIGKNLLEHAQAIQLMELVVNCNDLVIFAVEAVKDHGLLVNSLGNESMVKRSTVHSVVVMLWKTIVMLNVISEAVWSKGSWAVATSHSCHSALD